MNLWFYAIAALMLVAALACVAAPLLRAGRRAGRARAPFVLALALVFALPLAAIGLYVLFGAPQALQPRPANAVDLAQATDELRARLQSSPDHPEGWVLLAQAYASMGRLNDARDAFGQALKLKPDDPDLIVAYVEADAQARPDHRIDSKSRDLLGRVVTALDNKNQRAYWLLGIGDYQAGEFENATTDWWRLLELLPEKSNLAAAVRTQIAMAQARKRGLTQAQADASAKSFAQWQAQIVQGKVQLALPVHIKLDPKFAAHVSSSDPMSVEVSPTNDPQRELLNLHFKASQLPLSITLTDAMATSKDFKLSMFPRLNIQAGILISGSSPPGYGTAIIGYGSVDTDTDTPLVVILNLLTLSGPEHARPVSFGAGRHVSESAIPKLVINVKLDPKLASKVAPNDTLFVYARAVEGPPMPLAVARIRASSLPSTVTLTDAMAMTPQRKLSSFPQVEVVARISPSGDALPHAGDLESAPVQTATRAQQPIVLTIDRVH